MPCTDCSRQPTHAANQPTLPHEISARKPERATQRSVRSLSVCGTLTLIPVTSTTGSEGGTTTLELGRLLGRSDSTVQVNTILVKA